MSSIDQAADRERHGLLILPLRRPMLNSRLFADGFAAGSVGDPVRAARLFLFPAMVLDFLVSILTVILAVILGGWGGLVGRFVLRVASLGGVRAAPIDVPLHEFNWFYCRRSENWLIEVESTVAEGIGIVLCFIYFALFLHFF